MEANEIMNEGIMETTEELVSTSSGASLKIFGGVLALAGLAYGGYKLWKKRKAKKELIVIPENVSEECSDEECSDEE